MEIETTQFYQSKVGHTHHNLATITDVCVGAKENRIFHKSITLFIFDNEGKTILDLMKFNYEGSFIAKGTNLNHYIRTRIEENYTPGNVFRVEVNPEEA